MAAAAKAIIATRIANRRTHLNAAMDFALGRGWKGEMLAIVTTGIGGRCEIF
jgi:hypothetical protein